VRFFSRGFRLIGVTAIATHERSREAGQEQFPANMRLVHATPHEVCRERSATAPRVALLLLSNLYEIPAGLVKDSRGDWPCPGRPLRRSSPQFSLLGSFAPRGLFQPAFDYGLKRVRVEVMKLVAALAPGRYQTHRFQHVQVLRYRLTGQPHPVLHR